VISAGSFSFNKAINAEVLGGGSLLKGKPWCGYGGASRPDSPSDILAMRLKCWFCNQILHRYETDLFTAVRNEYVTDVAVCHGAINLINWCRNID